MHTDSQHHFNCIFLQYNVMDLNTEVKLATLYTANADHTNDKISGTNVYTAPKKNNRHGSTIAPRLGLVILKHHNA